MFWKWAFGSLFRARGSLTAEPLPVTTRLSAPKCGDPSMGADGLRLS